jgi:hypothetical protein
VTRHQRWILAFGAAIATVFLPGGPARILATAVPVLWSMAYVAHRCDLLNDRVQRAEDHLADEVSVAVADIVIASRQPPANQRDRDYRQPERPLRSV